MNSWRRKFGPSNHVMKYFVFFSRILRILQNQNFEGLSSPTFGRPNQVLVMGSFDDLTGDPEDFWAVAECWEAKGNCLGRGWKPKSLRGLVELKSFVEFWHLKTWRHLFFKTHLLCLRVMMTYLWETCNILSVRMEAHGSIVGLVAWKKMRDIGTLALTTIGHSSWVCTWHILADDWKGAQEVGVS